MIRSACLIAGVCLFAPAAFAAAPLEALTHGRFGEIHVYQRAAQPREVVLFLSGDGGWNLGVVTMAQHLADNGALVAGIDIRHYLQQLENSSDPCVAPSADAEDLSRFLQSRLALTQYLEPTLVGYSSGATLVYATLLQAPAGTFKGALSIGFCPDLDLKKPLCKGAGVESTPRRSAQGTLQGVDLSPARALPAKWISLQGQLDQVCPYAATQKFIAKVNGGEMILLPKVGHGFSVEKNWLPQYQAAYQRITTGEPKKP